MADLKTYDEMCDDVRKRLHELVEKPGFTDEYNERLHKLVDEYMDDAEDAEDEKSMSIPIEERLIDILFVYAIYKPDEKERDEHEGPAMGHPSEHGG